jgi:hypothetical protein
MSAVFDLSYVSNVWAMGSSDVTGSEVTGTRNGEFL